MVKLCPICRRRYDDRKQVCDVDGMRLRARRDEQTGRVFAGRYQLLARVGSGGMAEVFRALDLQENKPRAVKILRADLSSDPEVRERFEREVRAVRLVDHANVVRTFDFGVGEDGKPFIVLEYLDGLGLAELLAKGPLPLGRARRVIAEVGRALSAAHACGVIHRDVKPENIMLLAPPDGEGPERIKILDFGLVQIAGDVRLTATGQVFGTPEYISPEQATGEDASPASDQYALGVVFFEMLTGRPPFIGPPAQVLMAHFKATPEAPSGFSPGREVTPAVDAIVLRMLAKRPAERFPDLDAVCRAVEALPAWPG